MTMNNFCNIQGFIIILLNLGNDSTDQRVGFHQPVR